jgi:hypothetical protein
MSTLKVIAGAYLSTIIPEPMWDRPMPNIPDEEIYEDDDDEDD